MVVLAGLLGLAEASAAQGSLETAPMGSEVVAVKARAREGLEEPGAGAGIADLGMVELLAVTGVAPWGDAAEQAAIEAKAPRVGVDPAAAAATAHSGDHRNRCSQYQGHSPPNRRAARHHRKNHPSSSLAAPSTCWCRHIQAAKGARASVVVRQGEVAASPEEEERVEERVVAQPDWEGAIRSVVHSHSPHLPVRGANGCG